MPFNVCLLVLGKGTHLHVTARKQLVYTNTQSYPSSFRLTSVSVEPGALCVIRDRRSLHRAGVGERMEEEGDRGAEGAMVITLFLVLILIMVAFVMSLSLSENIVLFLILIAYAGFRYSGNGRRSKKGGGRRKA